MKTHTGLVAVIAILVIAITAIVACDDGSSNSPTTPSLSDTPPSNEIIEAAVYEYMTGLYSVYGLTPTYEWLEQVEIIRIGIPYSVNPPYGRKCWPIEVRLIGNQHREEVEGITYQDHFGDWQVSIVP